MTNNLHNNNNNNNNISFSSIVTISKTSVNWPHTLYHSPMLFVLNWAKNSQINPVRYQSITIPFSPI